MKKVRICYLAIVLMAITSLTYAQESKEVDPSKPTNLYTQVNAMAEYTSTNGDNDLIGTKFNVQYTFNPDNLIMAEVPLLYNSNSNIEKFGLADIRVRYFMVVKRNISAKFIALAPFVDVTFPTGSFEDGLGKSTTSIGLGTVFGYVLTKKIALFPGISYVHITKPSTDLIPDAMKFAGNGINLQSNVSISFSKSLFLFVNPVVTFLNSNEEWTDIWTGEFNLNYIVTPNKLKVNIGYFPNFTAESNTIRTGVTLFL